MGATIREWIWTHAVSKLRLARMLEEQRARDAASTQRPPQAAGPIAPEFPVNASGAEEPRYRAEVFDVRSLDEAKAIILTAEAGTTSGERWELETPYLVTEIGRALEIDERSCVLDYGCGIGRLSKGLIATYGCSVIGVDISPSMRHLALQFVQSDRFIACAPKMLDVLTAQGLRTTHAVACWVIQHCATPDVDLARIESVLAPRGRLYVLNLNGRAIPSDRGWISDDVSVERLLTDRFEKVAKGCLPVPVTTPEIAQVSYTMTLRKRN